MSGGTLAYKMGFGKGLLGVLHRKKRTRVSLGFNHWFGVGRLFQQQRTYVVSNHQEPRQVECVQLRSLFEKSGHRGLQKEEAALLKGH